MTKYVRIINSDTETFYIDMTSVQWVREIHNGEEGDQTSVTIYFSGGAEETNLQLEGGPARKFLKQMDLGG